jgi:serine/threonine protein kinase
MSESLSLASGEGLLSWTDTSYINLSRLGTGGSAETYLMLCTSGNHKGLSFAVKVFRRIEKRDRLINFFREVNLLRSLKHPAIMKVFDEGLFREQYPFVVVEYLPKTLHDVIRSKAASFLDKLSYSLHLISALDYLQRRDPPVIHRDIKPKNIFVKGGSCVLGDFGLMKHWKVDFDEDKTVVKESPGPGMPRGYRTPDLVDYLRHDRPLTPSSDIFQVGLVLAEMFTGVNPEKPLKGDDFTKDVELDPLEELDHRLGTSVRALIEAMLEQQVEKRPRPAHSISAFLGLYLDEAKQVAASNEFEG